MRTFLSSIVLAIATVANAQTNPLEWAYCDTGYRAAGGVVAVITVNTNLVTGESYVLPVGVQMCDEVTNNPLWYVGFNFGSNVTILPRVNVKVSPGYIYYGPPVDGQPDYTYSSRYPILIEASTNLCSPRTNEWTTNFYLCLYDNRSQNGQAGPCQVLNTDNHLGSVAGHLYSCITNGLDAVTTYGPNITNSLMGRFGPAACDNRYDTSESRMSIAFLYFNLPPRETPIWVTWTDPWGEVQTKPSICQPGTNFLQYPYQNGWCGYDTNYTAGFSYGLNEDNTQNWTNYPSPCDTNTYSLQLFRARCEGNPGCQPSGGSFKQKLTK